VQELVGACARWLVASWELGRVNRSVVRWLSLIPL